MEKYLILSDLDDTLLNKKHELSRTTIHYIRKISKRGHIFVFCTGRPIQGTMKFYRKLKIDSPVVCDNGTNIVFPYNPSLNVKFGIDLDLFIDFCTEVKDYIYASVYSENDKIYFQNRNEVPIWVLHFTDKTETVEGKMHEIADVSPSLPLFYIYESKHEAFEEILNKPKYESISVRAWGEHNGIYSYELFNSEASKGDALLYLRDYFGIAKENTIGFGDQMNDVELVQKAFDGVAMVNGEEKLKLYAKHVTKYPNYKNGVVKYLKTVLK